MAPGPSDEPSSAEWKVLRIVGDRRDCATRDVVEAAAARHGWTASTVKTLLRRLVEKGHLHARPVGNTQVYRTTATVRRALLRAADGLLDSAKQGTVGSLLAYMVKKSSLSQDELEELRGLLDAERQRRDEEEAE